MFVPLPLFLSLAANCAPTVAPETLQAVVRIESGFESLAVGVNGEPDVQVRASTIAEASAAVRALVKQGRSVDLGLGQINSRNLNRLGLTIEAAFDPCRNLAAAGAILAAAYAQARPHRTDDQAGLRAALSIYNTGDATRGLRNGYVARVLNAVPQVGATVETPTAPSPSWDVFGHTQATDVFLITLAAPEASPSGEAP